MTRNLEEDLIAAEGVFFKSGREEAVKYLVHLGYSKEFAQNKVGEFIDELYDESFGSWK